MEMTIMLRTDLPDLPANMRHLPVDEDRGYPVPWFVYWENGKPEFRVPKPNAREMAWGLGKCWVCGNTLPTTVPGDWRNLKPSKWSQTFVIGPMCVVNRTTADPGCHKECAIYSATACPFLTKPQMVRRDNDLPEETTDTAGCMIRRNPGVICLWTSETSYQFEDGMGGWLIRIGEPSEKTLWYCQGREANAAEISESIRTGLPILQGMASQEGLEASAELDRMAKESLRYMPEGVLVA
jgi:hypothetical protein